MSQTSFTLYDPATGRVVVTGNCHYSDYTLQGALYPDLALTDQEADLDLDYVDLAAEPLVRRRPTLPGFDKTAIVADDIDAATLALPAPGTVIVDGQEHAITEAPYTVAIASPMPATYHVEIGLWPYLPFKADIIAS